MTKMPNYISTTNACKLCKPLGAALAFRGMEGTVPYLHGSQGCATYMRRYIISHFNEPIDIASSSLSEKHAVYGGAANLKLGLVNVNKKYEPKMIGIATTCLTETIGDDVPMILKEFAKESGGRGLKGKPLVVNVSTPSYSGTHMEGFHGAVAATIEQLTEKTEPNSTVNLLPGFVSSADYRLLHEIMADFHTQATILPDLSETLDGTALLEYEKVPRGGTPLKAIKKMAGAEATLEFGRTLGPEKSGGEILKSKFGLTNNRLGLPIGISETDRFFDVLTDLTGSSMPRKYELERGRLIDAYVDGHKYIFGKKAIIYGEEDMVVGLTSFLAEIGVQPILCASGGKSGKFKEAIAAVTDGILSEQPLVYEGMDFFDIAEQAEDLGPDLLVGHSKGYPLAKKLNIPLIRVGFPIHDRIGGQRIVHLGYRGAQYLFDTVVNCLIEKKQNDSPIGYSYM